LEINPTTIIPAPPTAKTGPDTINIHAKILRIGVPGIRYRVEVQKIAEPKRVRG
jgi:hypothetical protein